MSYKFIALLVLMIPMASFSQTKYVVQPGDTILKIADRTLGNTDRKNSDRYKLARKIQALNPTLKDPNALEPGQTLILPGSATKTKSTAHAEAAPAPEPAPVAGSASSAQQAPAAEKELEHPHKAPVTSALPAPEPPPFDPHHSIAPETSSKKVHASSEHPNFIFIQPRYQILEIKTQDLATETKASMKSKSSLGLDLQYGLVVSEHAHLLFQAGVTQTQFDDIEGAGATISHSSETLKSFGAGIAYEVTSRLHADLMFILSEHTFLMADTLPAYDLKSVLMPGAELNLSFDLYSGTSNIFGISAIGEYLATATKDGVEYKSSLEPLGALYWQSNFGHDHVNYKVTLTYKQGHQETSVSEQHEDVTSLGVGLFF